MDDQETAARVAAIMLSGELVEDEMYADIQRLHPTPAFDAGNELDPRHPEWRARWGPLRRVP